MNPKEGQLSAGEIELLRRDYTLQVKGNRVADLPRYSPFVLIERDRIVLVTSQDALQKSGIEIAIEPDDIYDLSKVLKSVAKALDTDLQSENAHLTYGRRNFVNYYENVFIYADADVINRLMPQMQHNQEIG